MFSSLFKSTPRANPAEFAAKVRSGEAVLVDVREADEWPGGVLQSAALLSLSDLHGARREWRDFLKNVGNREVLVYCVSGVRSGLAARTLEREGVRALNAGGIDEWTAAGWEIVPPDSKPAATPG